MINVVSSSSSCYNDCVALPLLPAPSNHCTLYTAHEPHFCTSNEFLAHPILHLDEYIPLPYFFLPTPMPRLLPTPMPRLLPTPMPRLLPATISNSSELPPDEGEWFLPCKFTCDMDLQSGLGFCITSSLSTLLHCSVVAVS